MQSEYSTAPADKTIIEYGINLPVVCSIRLMALKTLKDQLYQSAAYFALKRHQRPFLVFVHVGQATVVKKILIYNYDRIKGYRKVL